MECRLDDLDDLRWHDVGHEYASRLVERGVPLAQVRDLLGHASITTDRALRQPKAGEPADRHREAGERTHVRALFRELLQVLVGCAFGEIKGHRHLPSIRARCPQFARWKSGSLTFNKIWSGGLNR